MPTHNTAPRTPATQKNNAKGTTKATSGGHDSPVTPNRKPAKNAPPPQLPPLTPGKASVDYEQIQNDELEVLKSVFMDDYKHVERAGAWNKSDHAFKLRLKAPSDDDYSCVLSVLMTATYPRTAPTLTLTMSENIRPHHRQRLEELIKLMPKRLIGQEMIYEIAVAIQDALEDIVQNRLMDQDKPSLDQERALKVKSEQKRAEQHEEEERQKMEQKAKEEQMKLEKEIEDELRRQREHAKETNAKRRQSNMLAAEDETAAADTEDCVLFDRAIRILTSEGPLVFRKVCGMVKVAKGPMMSVYTVRPAFPVHENRNVPLVLKQIDLPDRFVECSEGKQKIQNLEQEIDSLRNLKHPNVVAVYESKITRSATVACAVKNVSTCSPGGWKAFILTEYANKGSLYELLDTVDSISADIARSWTISLLEGLDYIHRSGAVHSGIHAGNILLFRHGSGKHATPKFADISYTRTLREILDLRNPEPTLWTPPELSQPGSNRKGTRKADIWNFGVVFLQMIFGLKIIETYESPQKLLHAMNLSESLSDFLESIFRADPKRRPTAFELLPSEFLRNDDPITTYTHAPPTPTNVSRSFWSTSNNHHHNFRARHGSAGGTSRYASDFVELGNLGKGGYGQVVKARNRLDGREYAIKKIMQTSGVKLTEILSEVMLLSRLNHRYVIRYFTAWLEEPDSLNKGRDFVDGSEGDDAISFSDDSISGETVSHTTHTHSKLDSGDTAGSDGVEIEFGHSTGLDFISNSAGYPNIQFGSDSEEDESDTEEEDSDEEDDDGDSTASKQSAVVNALKRTVSSDRKRGKVVLYIQMSLAESLTLRDRIDQGMSLEESWKLFRQVLEGLAHIHGLGIIHRDLKPENIFIDLSGDPQIGDFGLATNDLIVNSQMSKVEGEVSYGDNELTTNVGTALYVAPELRGASQGNYNEKVDMYSLGIIFFEMVYPVSSRMERAQVLSKLREPDIAFPSEFWTEKRTVQGNIIKTLLSHKPAERPSSTELLNSGKLPFMIEDKTIRHALQSLSDPNTPYHSQVMQALFTQNTKEYKNHTYNVDYKEIDSHELLLQSMVKERLTDIFRNHGAVETTRPLLMPRSKYYLGRDVVQLMDPKGTLVQLPYDLTLPHAQYLARSKSPAPKTFAFGTVYREKEGGGQPRSAGEVDFDIVSHDSLDLLLQEAEVIKVVDEVIDAFPGLKAAQMCYHINHSNLLDAIMDFCRIGAPVRAHAKEALSKLHHRGSTWTKIRNELVTSKLGILPTSLDDLARFDWRDEPDKAFEQILEIFEGTSHTEKVKPIATHIRTVVSYLRQFGVHRKIYINPLGTYNDKFYRGGLVFQCIYDTKKRDVFAAGGRYDSLILDQRPKLHTPASETHAVNLTMGWHQIFNSMTRHHKALQKHKPDASSSSATTALATLPRRTDVIVSAYDLASGTSLLAELWAAGIRAELGQEHKHDSGAAWVVTVKAGAVTGDRHLKVKSLLHKADVELKPSELISWLQTELSVRSPLLPQRLPPAHELDVRILAPDRKDRKVKRTAIIDAAQRTAGEAAARYLQAPVAAVDVKEGILAAMVTMGLGDGEGWKRLMQSAPAPERKYVGQVQELLEEIRGEGWKECWVFSFRTGAAGIVHLG